ncbi:MAG: CBS domain-containing protein [Gammaproteobacteria bacterium]
MNPHSRLGAIFLRSQPAAAARILEDFPAESAAQYLTVANPLTAKYVIEHFSPGFAASCLSAIEPQAAGQLFSLLLTDLQIMLLRQLDRGTRESLLSALRPDRAASLRRLLPYPEGTAGALMEAPLASVPEELSVREAVKRIKQIRRGMKFYVYVTTAVGQLTGVLTLHELISAPSAALVKQKMHRHIISLSPAQSILTVFNSPYWQEYHALPVTDENNMLLGVIRQKSMRRFQEASFHTGAVNNGLGTFVAVGELFAVTAGQLLATLIATGTSLTHRDPHG